MKLENAEEDTAERYSSIITVESQKVYQCF